MRRLPAARHPGGSEIVCTVTGHGLKDPDIASEQCGSIIPAKAEKGEIMKLLRQISMSATEVYAASQPSRHLLPALIPLA